MFQALYFGGPDSLPPFLARIEIPGLDVVVDPCAAILVLIVTALLCLGIKEVLLVFYKKICRCLMFMDVELNIFCRVHLYNPSRQPPMSLPCYLSS